jgi:hypothetical protein
MGIGRLVFYFGELLAQFTRVKDTPAGRGPWSLERYIAVPVHPAWVIAQSSIFRLQVWTVYLSGPSGGLRQRASQQGR